MKRYLLSFLIIADILAFSLCVYLSQPRYLEVNYLDVGQGDSIFIETPDSHQILIDGGPDNMAAIKGISAEMPFWDKTIDLVVLSHPDSDHITGLFEVLDNYKVANILWTGVEKDNDKIGTWKRLLAEEEKEGDKVYIAKKGDKIMAGDVEMDIVYPDESFAGEVVKDANDTSIVGRLSFRENSFLFPGDISSKIEKKLLDEDIKADILKVAHHGSKYSTSEDFLKRVDPQAAVIQVGKNSYGHPTPETLTRLDNLGIMVLRNDLNGNIKIVSDGKDYKIITNK
jgi:competence protein ComEC